MKTLQRLDRVRNARGYDRTSDELMFTQDSLEHGDQFGRWTGLLQVRRAARLLRQPRAVRLIACGEDYDRNTFGTVVRLQPTADFPSIDIWQCQVQQDDCWLTVTCLSVALLSRGRRRDVETGLGAYIRPELGLVAKIVDDQDPDRRQ